MIQDRQVGESLQGFPESNRLNKRAEDPKEEIHVREKAHPEQLYLSVGEFQVRGVSFEAWKACGQSLSALSVGLRGPGISANAFQIVSAILAALAIILEATIRHLSRPQEAPPDRQLVVHQVHHAHDRAADRREILRAVARPVPKIVLQHPDVQNPMQLVLDRPTVPDRLLEVLGRHLPAQDVGCGFRCGSPLPRRGPTRPFRPPRGPATGGRPAAGRCRGALRCSCADPPAH